MFVAAGGGGDVLASTVVASAVGRGGTVPLIATYAWDRLVVDPLPGPRGPDSFTGLQRVGELSFLITGRSVPVAPAGSTLPRLAGQLPVRLLLLDPYAGGRGLAGQLREAMSLFDVDEVVVVDVGGDIVAAGDEPGLKSPLADSLVLAACSGLPVPAEVMVAGAGLDGELPADHVRARMGMVGGGVGEVLSPGDVGTALAVFEWHPSEASAMLAAAVLGARGVVEVRDGGMQVRLDDSCMQVWSCPASALAAASLLAPRLADTGTLAEAEQVIRQVCGFSEIDYERAKAARLTTAPAGQVDLGALAERAGVFGAAAARRGADFVTFRRVSEAIGCPAGDYERLRADLVRRWPGRATVPLWALRETTTHS